MTASLQLSPGSFRTVEGISYGTPKEVWGFRAPPRRGDARAIAQAFLRANAQLLGLEGVRLNTRRVIPSAGGHHVILSQVMEGILIHRAYVTVHLDREKRVYMVKNRAVPKALLKPTRGRHKISNAEAKRIARRELAGDRVHLVFLDCMKYWFPLGKLLLPAWRLQVHRRTPTTRSEEILFVHARTGTVLSRFDNLAGRNLTAKLFDPHPLAVVDWQLLAAPPSEGSGYFRRALRPDLEMFATVRLRNVPASGLLNGPRVSTKLTRRRIRVRKPFEGKPHQPDSGFEEVMVWYHLDEAMRYLEKLGYRNRRAIFRKPISVNARGTAEDNSWYSPGLRTLTFGTGGVDDAEDAETILHEFGHAVQDAICPGFGQSADAAAMGEGFGDYLAGSFFASRKPRALRDLVMSWNGFEDSEEEPPRVRPLDSPLTYESFDHRSSADEHDNGLIWSATLWEIWRALGRDVADRIIIESHFQLDGFTTFARGARAIIDADRNLFDGRHVSRLRRIFRRRGIGPVE